MQGLGLVGIQAHARGLANVLGTMPLLQGMATKNCQCSSLSLRVPRILLVVPGCKVCQPCEGKGLLALCPQATNGTPTDMQQLKFRNARSQNVTMKFTHLWLCPGRAPPKWYPPRGTSWAWSLELIFPSPSWALCVVIPCGMVGWWCCVLSCLPICGTARDPSRLLSPRP